MEVNTKMPNWFICLAAILMFGNTCMSAENTKKLTTHLESLKRLEGLLGTWKSVDGESVSYEIWTKESDTHFSGLGLTKKGNDTTFTEKMKIEALDSGLYFIADVAHNPAPVYFKMIRQDFTETVFENPTHDFPTRVIYKHPAGDSLHARIEGLRKDKQVGIDFAYQRETPSHENAKPPKEK